MSFAYPIGAAQAPVFESDQGGRIAIPARTEPNWDVPFPKKNVCKKPGEWQMLEVTFRAPRFDATGAKIEDAVFESVVLNDETLYENLKVTGPLLGSAFPAEAPLGPFIIRGTRGQCAYRMVRIRPADWDKRQGSGWRQLSKLSK